MRLITSDGLSTHRRLLSATFLREVDLTLGKNPFSFLAALLEPMAMIALMCGWHFLLALRPPYGTDAVLYLATGYYVYYVFLYMSQSAMLSKASGPSRRFPIEKTLETIIASSTVELITYIMVGIVLFAAIYVWLNHQAYPWNWSYILEAVGAMVMLGVGSGMCSSVIQHHAPWWRLVWKVAIRATHIVSGVLMVPEMTPIYIRDYIAWVPTLHAVTRFRQGFYPQYPHLLYSGTYMWLCSLGVLVLGLSLMRIYRRELG